MQLGREHLERVLEKLEREGARSYVSLQRAGLVYRTDEPNEQHRLVVVSISVLRRLLQLHEQIPGLTVPLLLSVIAQEIVGALSRREQRRDHDNPMGLFVIGTLLRHGIPQDLGVR